MSGLTGVSVCQCVQVYQYSSLSTCRCHRVCVSACRQCQLVKAQACHRQRVSAWRCSSVSVWRVSVRLCVCVSVSCLCVCVCASDLRVFLGGEFRGEPEEKPTLVKAPMLTHAPRPLLAAHVAARPRLAPEHNGGRPRLRKRGWQAQRTVSGWAQRCSGAALPGHGQGIRQENQEHLRQNI